MKKTVKHTTYELDDGEVKKAIEHWIRTVVDYGLTNGQEYEVQMLHRSSGAVTSLITRKDKE